MDINKKFMMIAVEEAKKGLQSIGTGPFGACITKDKQVIAVGHNTVVADNDPTSHAEINVIREACRKLKSYSLKGCKIYSTCEPCPMCLGAIYWSRIDELYYGCSRFEAAKIGFDDQFIYDEVQKPEIERDMPTVSKLCRKECSELFKIWINKKDRIRY